MMKKSLIGLAIAATMGYAARFNQLITLPRMNAQPLNLGSTRYRAPGQPRPSGSKLARMAAEGRLGTKRMTNIGQWAQRTAYRR